MKRSATFARVFDKVTGGLYSLAGALLVFALLAVSADVLSRYFLNQPIGWVLEIAEYILLYIPLLGAAWLLRQDGHVRIDLLFDALDAGKQRILNIITSLVGAITSGVLAYWGGVTTWDHFRRGIFDTKMLQLPKFIILVVIPVGFSLLVIEFLRKARGYATQNPQTDTERGQV